MCILQYAATHPSLFGFNTSSVPAGARNFVDEATTIFLTNLKLFLNNEELGDTENQRASINVIISVASSDLTLDWNTNESYTLDLHVPVNGTSDKT